MSSVTDAQDELLPILLSRWQCNDAAGSAILFDDIGGVSLPVIGTPLMQQPSAIKNDPSLSSVVGNVDGFFGVTDIPPYVFGNGGTLECITSAEPNGNEFVAVSVPGQMEMVISGSDVIFNLWTTFDNTVLTASGALGGLPQLVQCIYDETNGIQTIYVDGQLVASSEITGSIVIPGDFLSMETTATISSSSLNITGITAGTAGILVGAPVSGVDIPINTFVTDILSSNSVTVNNQPTGNATETVTFGLAIEIAAPRNGTPISALAQSAAVYSEPLSLHRVIQHFQAFRQILSDPTHSRFFPRIIAGLPQIVRNDISISSSLISGRMSIRGGGSLLGGKGATGSGGVPSGPTGGSGGGGGGGGGPTGGGGGGGGSGGGGGTGGSISPMTVGGTNFMNASLLNLSGGSVSEPGWVLPEHYQVRVKNWDFTGPTIPPDWVALDPAIANLGYTDCLPDQSYVIPQGNGQPTLLKMSGTGGYKQGILVTAVAAGGNFHFQYGRLRFFVRMPSTSITGGGAWPTGVFPALWLQNLGFGPPFNLPAGCPGYELDVDESPFSNNQVFGTEHSWNIAPSNSDTGHWGTEGSPTVANFNGTVNCFEVIWQPGMRTWGINGVAYQQLTTAKANAAGGVSYSDMDLQNGNTSTASTTPYFGTNHTAPYLIMNNALVRSGFGDVGSPADNYLGIQAVELWQ